MKNPYDAWFPNPYEGLHALTSQQLLEASTRVRDPVDRELVEQAAYHWMNRHQVIWLTLSDVRKDYGSYVANLYVLHHSKEVA